MVLAFRIFGLGLGLGLERASLTFRIKESFNSKKSISHNDSWDDMPFTLANWLPTASTQYYHFLALTTAMKQTHQHSISQLNVHLVTDNLYKKFNFLQLHVFELRPWMGWSLFHVVSAVVCIQLTVMSSDAQSDCRQPSDLVNRHISTTWLINSCWLHSHTLDSCSSEGTSVKVGKETWTRRGCNVCCPPHWWRQTNFH